MTNIFFSLVGIFFVEICDLVSRLSIEYDVQSAPVISGFASASKSSRTIGSDPLSDAIFKAVPFRCGPHLRSTT